MINQYNKIIESKNKTIIKSITKQDITNSINDDILNICKCIIYKPIFKTKNQKKNIFIY